MEYSAKILFTIALALSFSLLNLHSNPQENKYNQLHKELFNSILASKTWEIVFNKKIRHGELCSETNRRRFKDFLEYQQHCTPEIIKLLSCSLVDNNLLMILHRMRELGYSFKKINSFKNFLLALFAPRRYNDIKCFEESIKERDETNIPLYLSKGINPNWIVSIDNDIQTGLMLAINLNNPSIVSMLLKNPNININSTNTENMNALMMSIKNQNEDIARLLLKRDGWNFWQFNTERETAIALASIHLPQLEDVIANQFKPYLRFQD